MAPTQRRSRSPSISSVTSGTSAMRNGGPQPDQATHTSSQEAADERATRVWLQQQMADRQKMKDKLPSVIVFLFELLLEPIFPFGEPFDIYMRKVAVLTLAAMCSSSPCNATWMALAGSTDQYGWNSKRLAAFFVSVYLIVHPMLFNYFYLRRTKTCPRWLADLTIFAAEGIILTMTLFLQAIDSRSIALCSLLLAALMSPKLLPLHAAIHGAIYLLHHFRALYKSSIPQLVFDWDEDGFPMSEKILYTFLGIFPPCMAVIGVYVIISGYIKRSKEAQTTNIMTITIADQLQRYDTKAVGKTIEQNRDQVNEKLVDAFDAIRTNLESYRPHIPRYLIDAAVERAEEAEAREFRAALALDDDEGSLYSDNISCASNSRRPRSPKTPVMQDSISSHSHASTPTASGVGPSPSSAVVGTGMGGIFSGLVTSVYIRVFDDESNTSQCTPTVLNKAIEEINVIAASTMASVHHIEQGIMLVTWNATKRTANHEIRACTFAHKAMAALQAYDGIRECAAAAVLSCKATAHFAGTSQMHFVLSHEERRRHFNMLDIAQRHKTVVCSPSIARNAEMQFVFLGFGVDCKQKLIYELVEPHATSGDEEDEWLYALNTQDRDAKNPYSQVTTAAAMMFIGLNQPAVLKHLPGIAAAIEQHAGGKEAKSDALVTPEYLLRTLDNEELLNRSTVKELKAQVFPEEHSEKGKLLKSNLNKWD